MRKVISRWLCWPNGRVRSAAAGSPRRRWYSAGSTMTAASMNWARAILAAWLKPANSSSAGSSSCRRNTASEAVPLANLRAADTLGLGRRTVGEVAAHACLVLAAGGGVAPGVGFEPPAADCVQERCQVAAAACLLERGVQVGVVAAER